MSKSKLSPGELYLEKSRLSGLMNDRNRREFETVAKMLDSPYSLEQAKAQVARAKAARKELEKNKS